MYLYNKRNKSIVILIIVVLLQLSINYICNADPLSNLPGIDDSLDEKIILIDPGHGGVDGGAVSKKGTLEKDLNLKIAFKLKEILEKKGYIILLTRDDDYGLYSDKGKIRDKKIEDLDNRCRLKKESECDIYISIHLNMFTDSKYSGAQVWYSDQPKEASELAHLIQNNLIEDLDKTNNRKEKNSKGAYKILRCHNEIPSVIVECGFLSNEEEERKLLQNEYQDKIALSIGESVDEFFQIVKLKNREDKIREIQDIETNDLDSTVEQFIEEHWQFDLYE
ncbi:N-acetylmuramoyl-L-alanine amidase CwlD [Clostridium grantii]|uniref:N-acetylmuramoyl-L-alanine amidase n=1 Tax=Clostridium grantii DSM 8605 TaxID=1121316 RepID=A0A1M5TTG0_9CLOT|nr:N-acetylmuramoyl-L-alanine amidase [Clostridium grantii DSM 8605]